MSEPSASKTEDTQEPWGWTRPQRIAIGLLFLVLLAFLGVQAYRWRFALGDPNVIINNERVSLPQRVDPNTAAAEELSRIGHLGEKLAARIIEWREARKAMAADAIVFHSPEDLQRVPGIGKKTMEQLSPYLQFPDDAETQPSTTVP